MAVTHSAKKVMEYLSRSVVEESSSMVLSLLTREGVGVHGQALADRARRMSERALRRGLECRNAHVKH